MLGGGWVFRASRPTAIAMGGWLPVVCRVQVMLLSRMHRSRMRSQRLPKLLQLVGRNPHPKLREYLLVGRGRGFPCLRSISPGAAGVGV